MMILMDNFPIKEKKYKEFQDWVKENEENLAVMAEKVGIKYRGTCIYVFGTGARINAAGCFMFELSKFADIDTTSNLFNDPTYEEMSGKLTELVVNVPTSPLLLRPFGEATLYEGR